MSDTPEHREAPRVSADYPLEYHAPDSGVEGVGRIRDLSDTGVHFHADHAIDEGAALSIRIRPAKPELPPLLSPAIVVRCAPRDDGDGFAIACTFE